MFPEFGQTRKRGHIGMFNVPGIRTDSKNWSHWGVQCARNSRKHLKSVT